MVTSAVAPAGFGFFDGFGEAVCDGDSLGDEGESVDAASGSSAWPPHAVSATAANVNPATQVANRAGLVRCVRFMVPSFQHPVSRKRAPMSLEDRIAAAAKDTDRDERPDGPRIPLQRRDAYDAYAEVHALVRDIYDRVSDRR
jgi:hypothetical protein